VYLLQTKEFRYYDTDTFIFFGFDLIEPLGSAIIVYPLGYLATWLLFRRFPKLREPERG
jgi:hypothetical protein